MATDRAVHSCTDLVARDATKRARDRAYAVTAAARQDDGRESSASFKPP